jgi:hypothetical protein
MAMSPEEIASFQARRQGVRQRYAAQGARRMFDQGQAQMQFDRGMSRLNTGWDRRRESLPNDFLRRGMMNSGVYQRGLQNYAGDRQNDVADQITAFQQRQAEFGFQQAGQEMDLQSQLDDIDMAERVRRAELASQLRGIL